jgi:hypothetical protein
MREPEELDLDLLAASLIEEPDELAPFEDTPERGGE